MWPWYSAPWASERFVCLLFVAAESLPCLRHVLKMATTMYAFDDGNVVKMKITVFARIDGD